MRTQISNTNIPAYRAFIVIIFAALFVGLTVLPLERSSSAIVLIILLLFFYYIFIGRFYKVEVDPAYLHFSDLQKKGKIELNKVISVKDEWFPYTFFLKSAYGITVRYLNEQGKVKKIKFLSPQTNWGGNPFNIPEIKYLKRMIASAKN